jgi:prophage regulatory protein
MVMSKSYPQLIRRETVLSLFPVSVSTLYERINSGLFPPPISSGGRTVFWIESEVHAVVRAMIRSVTPDELKTLVMESVKSRSDLWL